MVCDRIKLEVNMRDNPAAVTWQPSGDTVKIKLLNSDIDLDLDIGPKVIRQLKQALYWVPSNEKEERKEKNK